MSDLTLEQVKAAGLVAWREGSHDFYNPNDGLLYEIDWWSMDVYDDEDQDRGEDGGWYHLPGCNCEFCRP
jgi:hypothetical protein